MSELAKKRKLNDDEVGDLQSDYDPIKEELDTYNKMLKCGVPRGAVIQKIKNENNENLIDQLDKE